MGKDAYIKQLETQNSELKKRIEELERLLGINSKNSSKPPSSDPLRMSVALPKRWCKKRGARKGHQPHLRELLPQEFVKKHFHLKPEMCTCGSTNLEETNEKPLRHQIVDILPIKPEVIEYVQHISRCKDCGAIVYRPLPDDNPAYVTLGENLHRQGKFDEASQALYKLLEIRPNTAKAHSLLADIAGIVGDKKRAITHLIQIIKIEPTASMEFYRYLAELYEEFGKTKKAIKTLCKAIENLPEEKTGQAHWHLGRLLYIQRKYQEAFEEMEIALRINPDYGKQKDFREHYNSILTKKHAR